MGDELSEEFRSFFELFHLLVDEDPKLAMYPENEVSLLGECPFRGPDADRENQNWVIKGPHSGAAFTIIYDPSPIDRRKAIRWEWETPPVYDFHGGALQLTQGLEAIAA